MRIIAKVIWTSRAKFHCNRLTTLRTVSYSHSIVTMTPSCIIFEITRDTGQKRRFCRTPPVFDAPQRCSVLGKL